MTIKTSRYFAAGLGFVIANFLWQYLRAPAWGQSPNWEFAGIVSLHQGILLVLALLVARNRNQKDH